MKWKRLSTWVIEAWELDLHIRIIKDYGSMGRSKPLFCIEVNGKVVEHGLTTQREAKKQAYFNLYKYKHDFTKGV